MELKQVGKTGNPGFHLPFNRTRMELKQGAGYKVKFPVITFNRTRMELKQLKRPVPGAAGMLLTVPEWN